MARTPRPSATIGVRVADFGTSGGEFETGWTSFEGGGVRLGEATGAEGANPSDFVVATARLERPVRPGQALGAASQFLGRLLAGTQTSPVDVEVRLLDAGGVPAGRGFLYQIAIPTRYLVSQLDGSGRGEVVETFEFVAKDVQIVRS